jgi:hypothetical protein
MARLALALSLRRGPALGAAACAAGFLPAGVLLFARMARAWRNRAISSSMAFNIWSFKSVPFEVGGGGPQQV